MMKDGEEVEKREGAARMRERSDGQTGANIIQNGKWISKRQGQHMR